MTTVMVAASVFEEALPNVSWTRLAVAPFSFRWVTRRSAKAFVSLPEEWKHGDGHECGRQDRQRRVDGRRTTRVAARREVGAEPLQREPAQHVCRRGG